MTLDEAIEVHERRIKFAQVCVCGDCPINECIKEHQLHIEWLKELKAYRENDKEYLDCIYFKGRNSFQPMCCHNSKHGFNIRKKSPSIELGRPKKCPIVDKKEVDEVTLEGLYNSLALHIENRKKESKMIETIWERIKEMEVQNEISD